MILSTGEKVRGSGFGVRGNHPPPPTPNPRPKGITLVELLVVLAIIGLILGISVPGLTRYAGQLRLKSTTRQMVGLVSLARSLAISSRQNHAVVVDLDQREVAVLNLASGEPLERVLRLPSGVTVEVDVGGEPAPEPRIVFRPTGGLEGRTTTLVLADRGRSNTITVTGTTGAVSVQ